MLISLNRRKFEIFYYKIFVVSAYKNIKWQIFHPWKKNVHGKCDSGPTKCFFERKMLFLCGVEEKTHEKISNLSN